MAEKVEKYRWKCLVQPDATTINLILHAMVKVEGVADADRYLRTLLRASAKQHLIMESSAQDDAGAASTAPSAPHSRKPMVDIVSVSTVIQGWANKQEADKAQWWLDRMCADNLDEEDETNKALSTLCIQPNTISYTLVIRAWAQNGETGKAHALLDQQLMSYWECDANDDERLRPDRILFHTVLDAWSKVTMPNAMQKEAPLRAKELMHWMEETANKMDELGRHEAARNVHPNMETFGKLIAIY
ncbi:MAG: hypothetical protein SGILL_006134, partial [Bacillariaceae sp.]